MNRVEINAEAYGQINWADRLKSFGERILSLMGVDGWDVSVLLCDDKTIQAINARYRGIDEATDVLSFEDGGKFLDDSAGERYLAGDIVISLDSLTKNAEIFNVDADEELRRLLVHGLLHLSGLDHQDNSPDCPMIRRQEDLLALSAEETIFK